MHRISRLYRIGIRTSSMNIPPSVFTRFIHEKHEKHVKHVKPINEKKVYDLEYFADYEVDKIRKYKNDNPGKEFIVYHSDAYSSLYDESREVPFEVYPKLGLQTSDSV